MPAISRPRHLLSIDDLDGDEIRAILARSHELAAGADSRVPGHIAALLFFAPSTRTQYGFQSSVLRAKGSVISVDLEASRAGSNWGESLADTARVLSGFADLAVIRHPEAGGLFEFANASAIPVINAGNGMGLRAEHPTQALTDLFTIERAFGRIDGLKILIIGGTHLRAFRSQIRALAHFPSAEVFVLCPDKFWMEYPDQEHYRRAGICFTRVAHLDDVKREVDVIYHNGITERRGEPVDDYYAIDAARLAGIRRDAIIMHSLPRVEDLAHDVDDMPQARYFEQAHNGVHVRIAIIEHLIGSPAAHGHAP